MPGLVLVFQVSIPGKGLYKKAKYGDARIAVSDAMKQQSPTWLDIDGGQGMR